MHTEILHWECFAKYYWYVGYLWRMFFKMILSLRFLISWIILDQEDL